MFVFIKESNINLLYSFIKDMGESSKSFRYYESRDPRNAIKNHLHTLLFLKKEEIIGYGHLDLDPLDNKLWLGICINYKYCGMGYGKTIMDKLISLQDRDLYLTVDNTNDSAYHLYLKYKFRVVKSDKDKLLMKKDFHA